MDFRNHIELGHLVILERDEKGPKLNPALNRLRSDNASEWIAGKIRQLKRNEPMLGGADYGSVLAAGNAVLSGIDKTAGDAAERLSTGLAGKGIGLDTFVEAKMMEKTGLTPDWMNQHRKALESLVVTVKAGDERAIDQALTRHFQAQSSST